MKTIRVLVTDDSALMRKIIKDMLDSQTDIEVIGTARDGLDALKKIAELKPDLVTLDIQMPNMNGLECLSQIMAKNPLPVIMLSSLTGEGAEDTMKALSLGAVDFVQKPSGAISLDIHKVQQELIDKVRVGCRITPDKYKKMTIPKSKKTTVSVDSGKVFPAKVSKKLLLIGTSTGGPRALQEVIPRLPQNIPANILIVQHMPQGFTLSLANRLNSISAIEVKEAKDGDTLQTGLALLAPGGYHMTLGKGGVIKLNQNPTVLGVRPACDVLLQSVAEHYSGKIVNVIMTGMGRDGTDGTIALSKLKVYTIAEDKSSCVVYGMPKSIVDNGLADKVVPLSQIASEIMKAL